MGPDRVDFDILREVKRVLDAIVPVVRRNAEASHRFTEHAGVYLVLRFLGPLERNHRLVGLVGLAVGRVVHLENQIGVFGN